MATHPGLDGDTLRLLRVERTSFRARWAAVAAGVLLIAAYRTTIPVGYLYLAGTAVVFLVVANVLVARILARGATPRRIYRASLFSAAVDFIALELFMFAFLSDTNNSVRALFYLLPFIGAIRFQLRGALTVTAFAVPVLLLQQWFGLVVFSHEVNAASTVFKIGLGLVIAYTAGNMSSTLTRESREAERKNVALTEVNTAITGFVTVASHEMRTPLAVAKGITQVLSQPEVSLSDEQRKASFETLERQLGRLEELVDGLLKESASGGTDIGDDVSVARLTQSVNSGKTPA